MDFFCSRFSVKSLKVLNYYYFFFPSSGVAFVTLRKENN